MEQTSFAFAAAVRSAGRAARTARPVAVGGLAPGPDALCQRLERRIAAHLPATARLALVVTDNRHTMISIKRERGLYRLRLHRMFLEAESQVLRALSRYVVDNDASASQLLGQYIDRNHRTIRRASRRRLAPVELQTRGEIHDLQELFDALNRRWFSGSIDARITWGQRTAKRRRRNSIKMGSYSVEDCLIRVHPSLDRPFVPRYFVEWIVFHEMLHQVHPIPTINGRRQFHSPDFLDQERSFEHYRRARDWERRHLNRLLVY